MRYLVESGSAKVEIEISSESTDLMRAVEESAARLLTLVIGDKPATPALPFGYSLSADTERADPHPESADDE